MADRLTTRFEARVVPGASKPSLRRVADLDLDRIPDPDGNVRVLVSAEDAEALVDQGFEVVLLHAQRIQPLDAKLVSEDDAVRVWLEEQTRGVARQTGS